ncbi:3-keto-disaccharide hydrolase [Pedobacter sp. NJ-S-72]
MYLHKAIITSVLITGLGLANANAQAKHEDTEFYTPVPQKVTPGKIITEAPSDAIILFDGKNLDQWVMTDDRTQPAKWTVAGGQLTVNKKTGNIETKQSFGNYQLHIEWQVPKDITGTGQLRGNSGLFLASMGKGDLGYELQILDSYDNNTYTNGMAGSIYKQTTPLVNPSRKPGEWQTYDVIWTAPTFKADSTVNTPAKVTVLYNGVLVQNNFELKGPTQYIGVASYKSAHGPLPIKLQSHGDKSEPVSYRNIWIRELQK